MKKKLFAVLLTLILTLSLAACGSQPAPTQPGRSEAETTAAPAPAETTSAVPSTARPETTPAPTVPAQTEPPATEPETTAEPEPPKQYGRFFTEEEVLALIQEFDPDAYLHWYFPTARIAVNGKCYIQGDLTADGNAFQAFALTFYRDPSPAERKEMIGRFLQDVNEKLGLSVTLSEETMQQMTEGSGIGGSVIYENGYGIYPSPVRNMIAVSRSGEGFDALPYTPEDALALLGEEALITVTRSGRLFSQNDLISLSFELDEDDGLTQAKATYYPEDTEERQRFLDAFASLALTGEALPRIRELLSAGSSATENFEDCAVQISFSKGGKNIKSSASLSISYQLLPEQESASFFSAERETVLRENYPSVLPALMQCQIGETVLIETSEVSVRAEKVILGHQGTMSSVTPALGIRYSIRKPAGRSMALGVYHINGFPTSASSSLYSDKFLAELSEYDGIIWYWSLADIFQEGTPDYLADAEVRIILAQENGYRKEIGSGLLTTGTPRKPVTYSQLLAQEQGVLIALTEGGEASAFTYQGKDNILYSYNIYLEYDGDPDTFVSVTGASVTAGGKTIYCSITGLSDFTGNSRDFASLTLLQSSLSEAGFGSPEELKNAQISFTFTIKSDRNKSVTSAPMPVTFEPLAP